MNEPAQESPHLPLEPDSARPEALETLRHPAYFGAAVPQAGATEAPVGEPAPEADTASAHAPPEPAPGVTPRKRPHGLIALAAAACAVAVAAIVFALGNRAGDDGSTDAQAPPFAADYGEPIPAFRGYLLDPAGRGPLYTKDDTVGRPLVIVAWSTRDPQTLALLRAVTNLAAGGAHEEVTFLGLCLDPGKAAAIDALRESAAYTWPHLYNADARLEVPERPATVLNISRTPALYGVDALGRIRFSMTTADGLPGRLDEL